MPSGLLVGRRGIWIVSSACKMVTRGTKTFAYFFYIKLFSSKKRILHCWKLVKHAFFIVISFQYHSKKFRFNLLERGCFYHTMTPPMASESGTNDNKKQTWILLDQTQIPSEVLVDPGLVGISPFNSNLLPEDGSSKMMVEKAYLHKHKHNTTRQILNCFQ